MSHKAKIMVSAELCSSLEAWRENLSRLIQIGRIAPCSWGPVFCWLSFEPRLLGTSFLVLVCGTPTSQNQQQQVDYFWQFSISSDYYPSVASLPNFNRKGTSLLRAPVIRSDPPGNQHNQPISNSITVITSATSLLTCVPL